MAFEDRQRIPPGYTLITLAECGTTTNVEEVARVLEAFGDATQKPVFADPQHHALTLRHLLNNHPFHLYTEGMYYPPMRMQLLADWVNVADVPTTDKQRVAVKSGVYAFPLDLETWRLRPEKEAFADAMLGVVDVSGPFAPTFSAAPDTIAQTLYTDSIMPTKDEAQTLLEKSKSVGTFKKRVYHSLEDIFARGGPGVYYYVICRSPAESNFTGYLQANIGLPNVPQHILDANNTIRYIPEMMPAMETLAAEKRRNIAARTAALAAKKGISVEELEAVMTKSNRYGIAGWDANMVLEAPTKFQRLYNNTMRVRRASATQQGALNRQQQRSRRRHHQRRRSRTRKQRRH